MEHRTDIEALTEVLARRQGLRLALVFGSVAKGCESADSDVDVAVLADAPLDAEQRMALVGDLAEATGRAVDLIDVRTAGEPLIGEILAHGRRLLGTDEAYGDILSRHLLDAADFLPYADRIGGPAEARVDRAVVERKIEALRHCLQRLRDRRPTDAAALAADADLQDVLVLNLSRAVQLCVDIAAHLLAESRQPVPRTMGETFTHLAAAGPVSPDLAQRLRRAVGSRNIAVHNYEIIDWTIVHALTGQPLADFDHFAAAVAAHIAATGGPAG